MKIHRIDYGFHEEVQEKRTVIAILAIKIV